jgi:hypothetical protein
LDDVLDLATFEFLSELMNCDPVEPLMAVAGVIAGPGTVDAQEASEAVHA